VRPMLAAVAFLTRLPVRIALSAEDVGRGTRWFPLVGTWLGAVGALVAAALAEVPRLPAWMGTITVLTLWALATGAIHLDGLADLADGLGGHDREERLQIMRDPRLGSFGVLALLLVLGVKVGVLSELWARGTLTPVLVVAPTLARWTTVTLGVCLPYARTDDGIGRAAVRHRDFAGLAVATATTAMVAMYTFGRSSVWLWTAALAVTVGIGVMAQRRLGGVTGDVFGASVELTETAVVTVVMLMPGRS
jgi:adenosylcobinamide-GDP ribazoletransferase